MQRTFQILLAAVTTTLGLTDPVTAGVANGSFESSNFEGWRLEMARGTSYNQRSRPAGTATTTSEWGSDYNLSPLRAAVAGSKFAILGTLANGNFSGNRTYHISLNQQLSLTSGESVMGWSSFFNGDFEAQDSAWVKISDAAGNLVATPWQENSGCVPGLHFNAVPFHETTPWTQWIWQAPTDGFYTLSLGVTTHGDDNYASYGFFDDILVVPTTLPVPEPSTAAILVIGLAGLAARRRVNR